ncbi:uncharacterized protein [Branchiostoma lanceolatum]|uniref:uncharacterized protein n=1 Tax=Branchiostoma lanceolatum TaxID=7740 RepID=UPI0034538CA2
MNLFVGILNDTISQVKNDKQEKVEESGLSDLVRMIRQVLANGGEAFSDKKMPVPQNDIMADLYTPQIDRLQHRVELLQRHVRELQKTFTMWDYFVAYMLYLQSMCWQQYDYESPYDGYDSFDSMDYDFETVYA